MASTLTALLDEHMARSSAPVRFVDSDSVLDETTWSAMHDAALNRAAALQARGIERGDRVAILGFTGPGLVESIFGVLLAGAVVVMLPLPLRLAGKDAFIELTRARLNASDARLLLLDDFFVEQYEPGPDDPTAIPIDDLVADEVALASFEQPSLNASDLAVLQFTSGSTSAPRAVRLHHGALVANVAAIMSALELTHSDKLVTWLPLYHDMGLIGTLFVPAARGVESTMSPPQTFMGRPAMWMETVSRYGGTIVVAPNFAYALARRALRRETDLDLSPLRVAMCGAEPIDADSFEGWAAEGARFGLRQSAPLCVYGLAEATLAVTFPPLDEPLRADVVDRTLLETKDVAVPPDPSTDTHAMKRIVSLGRPLRGIAVRVVDTEGYDCGERQVGEVLVAGQSVMQGYDKHAQETARVMRDGWLHTGDQGYFFDGELYLCGRKKDVIIIGGRNIWPEDVEASVQDVEGIRKGNVIAFGVERSGGREALVVVAETRLVGDDAERTAEAASESVRAQIGLAPRHLVLIPPGDLPKTSSGKLQRNLCRTLYSDRELTAAGDAGHEV